MKQNTLDKKGIDTLMEVFYNKIRVDKNGLGDIFNAQVGTDDEAWRAHKAKISNFWQGMLLNEGDYTGQPLKAHLELPPFDKALFDVWLGLFEESLNQVFTPDIAQIVLSRAQMIANNFKRALEMHGR